MEFLAAAGQQRFRFRQLTQLHISPLFSSAPYGSNFVVN